MIMSVFCIYMTAADRNDNRRSTIENGVNMIMVRPAICITIDFALLLEIMFSIKLVVVVKYRN